jgi:hypothetical protein
MLAASLTSCLTLDSFFFTPEPVDEYRWDADDPCDPQLVGEIADAEHEVNGGPEPTCHPSLVPPEDRTEAFVAAAGNEIHYVYARRENAIGTIFYSHGRARHLGRYWDRAELMWGLGYNVMIYDYPGYGRSSGEPDEDGMNAAADAVLEVLPTMPGYDPDAVFFMGYSLGGSPAYEMALRAARGEIDVIPQALLSESAFCSTETLVQDGSYTNLTVEFLSNNPFDNCAKIREVSESFPVRILHGEADDFLTPIHAKLLEEASAGSAELIWFPEADHSELPVVEPQAYEDALTEFFVP